jgi:septum formation protein
MEVVLASASPRRSELLGLLVPEFRCAPSTIDEAAREQEPPLAYVQRMAIEKAAAHSACEAIVIGADTIVEHDTMILGKPLDRDHAFATLRRLSGRAHWVHTAIAMMQGDRRLERCVSTEVSFVPLTDAMIAAYLDTDEPWDKAGSYAIQGLAGSFVKKINGSYSSVVGLPLAETREMLTALGVKLHW